MDPLHIPQITARCVDTQTLDEIEAHDRCWSSLADPAQPVWDCIDSIWGRPTPLDFTTDAYARARASWGGRWVESPMQSNYTPGPWSFERDHGGTIFIYGKDADGITRQIGSFDDEDMGDDLPDLANARLAASAPALLEALIKAESLVEVLHSITEAKGARSIVWTALKSARAAIATALGEERA